MSNELQLALMDLARYLNTQVEFKIQNVFYPDGLMEKSVEITYLIETPPFTPLEWEVLKFSNEEQALIGIRNIINKAA